jgi:hypothetical protein
LQVVEGLQQLVAEFRVRDALLRESGRHGLAIKHAVDAEVLADIPQEFQHRDALGPVIVVHHDGSIRAREVIEALELATDTANPVFHDLPRVQLSLACHLGIANESSRTSDEGERPMTGLLEPANREDLREVSEVEARCSWVEPAVQGHRASICRGLKGAEISALRDELTPEQFVENR